MSEQEKAMKVLDQTTLMSAHCERGVIAVREDGQAGIALVAPNCIQYSEVFHPTLPPFDFILN